MNYGTLMELLIWLLARMEKHNDECNANLHGDGESFSRPMYRRVSRIQTQSAQTTMNELSSHGHSRFMTRTNRAVGRIGNMRSATAKKDVYHGIFQEGMLIQMT